MEEKIKSILSAYPNKLILSNLTDKSYKYKKTTIVKKIIAGNGKMNMTPSQAVALVSF